MDYNKISRRLRAKIEDCNMSNLTSKRIYASKCEKLLNKIKLHKLKFSKPYSIPDRILTREEHLDFFHNILNNHFHNTHKLLYLKKRETEFNSVFKEWSIERLASVLKHYSDSYSKGTIRFMTEKCFSSDNVIQEEETKDFNIDSVKSSFYTEQINVVRFKVINGKHQDLKGNEIPIDMISEHRRSYTNTEENEGVIFLSY